MPISGDLLRTFKNIKKGRWCPHCARNVKLSLEECQELAISRGGKCLSTEYINARTYMEWKCKEESHKPWWACFDWVKNGGNWCLTCAGNDKLTLEECQELAISRGGKCLSTEYKNKDTRMEWKCKEESHPSWFATFGSVKNSNTWCLICSGNAKLSLEECQELAISRGGKCLSTEYINAQTYIEWKCKEEYHKPWFATFNKIKNQQTWCPTCAGNEKLTLEECQELAISRGGECLSTEYINAHISMEWKCKEESHPSWFANFNNVKHANTWCPYCSKSRSEKLCREILEEYTGLPFPSIRPDWLKNITMYNLELDGFCEDLNFGFEYQGIQHDEYNAFFHINDQENFERQQERDKLKLELCKKRNIDVLIIPHTLSYQNENELRIFIKEELIKRLNCEFLFLE